MKNNKSLAQVVGSTFAIFQSAVDDFFTFAFKKVKNAGKLEREVKDPDSLKERAIDAAQKSATFLAKWGNLFTKNMLR